ncbi:hemerythrin domain-containing protein [Halanaerobaculum tunisiense]
MKVIELLREEHDNIKRMLVVMRKLCVKILQTDQVEFTAFTEAIDFVRNYADQHHHGKEEDILFAVMSEKLDLDDEEEEKDPIEAMFSEHDLGRYFINNLESALEDVKNGNQNAKVDVIGNAIAYTDLLSGHIYKENNIIYSYAQAELSSEVMAEVEEEAKIVEENANRAGIQAGYLNLVAKLEEQVSNIKL